ncbi:MAG TPA: tRNA preQ1(34) S-adenosylmethionine ribosyltransferase-isomerase QueA [bacterium]|nr:tRNA preQ1(34) S-adenosylmethionine ribosyltransferase-isomerase QueA [bacterium]
MRLADFDYALPPELIAQHPVHPRDTARLMVVDRVTGRYEHRMFSELPEFLTAGDAIVINDTRVIPARLRGRKPTGGAVEILLLRPALNPSGTSGSRPATGSPQAGPIEGARWEALVTPGRGTGPGTRVTIGPDVEVEIAGRHPGGVRLVHIHADQPVLEVLRRHGEVPLPPYVHERLERVDDYQTVYATHPGAVAAPTAGLHFTDDLIARLEGAGVQFVRITMHIGLGTFRPVTSDEISAHRMEAEWYEVSPDAAHRINEARRAGGRIVVVGTSTVRTLETLAAPDGRVGHGSGWATLFIYPGFQFTAADLLVTNFHLPKTTLMMLVSAFGGQALIRQAYAEAIVRRYRFYSFGDAMLIR